MSIKIQKHEAIENLNPFFQWMPAYFTVIGVIFATIAAVIASQALITGSFALVSEAIKLKLLPRLKIMYPGSSIGQMYIPAVNLILWIACSLVVVTFRTSHHMEAAYGLSITVTMLMTTAFTLFLFAPNWLSEVVGSYNYLFLWGNRSRLLYFKYREVLPWRFCRCVDCFSHFSSHVCLGTRKYHS